MKLSYDVVNKIVSETLRNLKWSFVGTRQRNFINYSVYYKGEDDLMGHYIVTELADGKIQTGWQPTNSNDEELLKLRDKFHFEMILPELTRIEQEKVVRDSSTAPMLNAPPPQRKKLDTVSFRGGLPESLQKMLIENAMKVSQPTTDLIMEVLKNRINEVSKDIDTEKKLDNALRNETGFTEQQISILKALIKEETEQKNTKAPTQGTSGRPHLDADIWAWEQVNIEKRPMNLVFKEWLVREDVVERNLQFPRRQFNKISKPEWKNGRPKPV